MGRLIEEISLRNKLHVFEDRTEAGRLLAEKLVQYKDSDGEVLGIPSGGVPVAKEIAASLNLHMDLMIVRKLQIPYNPEAGFGAMGLDGEVILNEGLLAELGLTEDEIRAQTENTKEVIKRRNLVFRKGRLFPSLKDRVVILVDDGLASGYTMLAAVRFVKRKMPGKIIVAVPTASKTTVELILHEVDELICLNVRHGISFAVADAYRNWYDLSDEEVLSIVSSII
ncbi:MAG: phosphoribosyltransferase [Euryarchaeota archaeon]|nr:phosphoribosyltransferase [Euryarchaeota archaeon]MBU4491608.1 phosphoribosyltransferase [Euryarchaeota archaeon]